MVRIKLNPYRIWLGRALKLFLMEEQDTISLIAVLIKYIITTVVGIWLVEIYKI